ncbi:histidine phosphatase family protein [Marinomonas sp. C2222]|uniref:Histidine phosphatase family protein n=1 Tax=Marinomonas sargassi TaxID=2984494 RepID=A0ABT2YTY5_9GAMM|nr:histidine phosphatase family protein [Marinomonas sargassi]MCV2403359.1 histidine phosphatase family protein [Marinomonas sargassi]
MKLFLIRHPKPEVAKGLCYGQSDVPLTTNWQLSSQPLKKSLTNQLQGKTSFYHSPLTRTALLANYISDDGSTPVDALKELDFADWDGLLWNDIAKSEIDLWAENIVNSAPYNGESLQDLADRVWCWWLTIQNSSDDNCVLVTHSGVIKVLVSLLCCWPLEECHRIDVGFCSLTELSIQQNSVMLKRLGAGDWLLN